jgi:hypothetical protein
MYPYLPGPAAAVTIAAMLRERDLTDAAVRSAVEERRRRARVSARRAVSLRPEEPGLGRSRGTWLLEHLPYVQLQERPPAVR